MSTTTTKQIRAVTGLLSDLRDTWATAPGVSDQLDRAIQALVSANALDRRHRARPEVRARRFVEEVAPTLATMDGQQRDLAMRGLRAAQAILDAGTVTDDGPRRDTRDRIIDDDVSVVPRRPPRDMPPPSVPPRVPPRDDSSSAESVREPAPATFGIEDCQYKATPGNLEEIGDHWPSDHKKRIHRTADPLALAVRLWYTGTDVERPVPLRVWARGGDAQGVSGHLGQLAFGGQYSALDSAAAVWRRSDGSYGRPRIEVLGDLPTGLIKDGATVEVSFGFKYGSCGRVLLRDLGIKGPNDSFIIRSLGSLGVAEFDGCWWVPHKQGMMHISGAHITKGWDQLVVRRWRINTEALFQEHEWYPKGGGDGALFLLDNDILGGVRSWINQRPHVGATGEFGPDVPEEELAHLLYHSERQRGAVICRRNKAVSPQWAAWVKMGSPVGAAATVATFWNSLSLLVFEDNEITDALGGALVLGWQPEVGVGNYVDEDGFTHHNAIVRRNKLTSPRGDVRPAVEINAANRCRLADNTIDSNGFGYLFDSSIAAGWGAPESREIEFAGDVPDNVWTYDRDTKKHIVLDDEAFRAKYTLQQRLLAAR